MDWFSAWEPVPYLDVEHVDVASSGSMLTAWLIVSVVALAALVAWYRQRAVRHVFWCAEADRDVEVVMRHGCVLACSAFDHPGAIACARRCVDTSFRAQWPPALPVLVRASGRT